MTSTHRRRHLLLFALTLFLAIWVGGTLLTDLVMIPTAFQSLDRSHAIAFGASAFSRFNVLECLLGASAILLTFALGRSGWGTPSRHRIALTIVCVMTGISLVFLLFLTPAITHRVEQLVKRGFDFSLENDMPPERESLDVLHHVYVGLDALKILGGLALFWLLASRSRR